MPFVLHPDQKEQYRSTRQRNVICQIFADFPGPLRADEVAVEARRQLPGIGVATVYRTIKLLAEEGWLQQVHLPGEVARFERTDATHHHFFKCTMCQKIFRLQGCAKAVEKLAPPPFRVTGHEILLYGQCANCQ